MKRYEILDRMTVTEFLRFTRDTILRFPRTLNSTADSAKREPEVKVSDVASMFTEYGKTPEKVRVFDDFNGDRIALTTVDNGLWIGFAGTDGDADIAAIVASPEGTIAMGSGDANGTEDGSVLSRILLADGALVSIGTQVFEWRGSLDQLTGCSQWIGLCDVLATDAERMPHTVDSSVVADGGLTVTNVAGFSFSSDATAPTKWTITSEKAGTIGNSAAEDATTEGPTANIYDTLRIEINASGDVKWLINGGLVKERAAAVATTAVLIPYIGMDSGTDARTNTVLTTDAILHEFARTTTNA